MGFPSIFTLHFFFFLLTIDMISAIGINGWPPEWNGYRTYWNGPWTFMGCTAEQGEDLVNLWSEIGRFSTERIIPDAKLGSSSRYGLNVMFSARDAGPKVAQVFQDIIDHRSYRTLNPGAGKFDLLVVCTNPVTGDDLLSRNVRVAATGCTSGKQKFLTYPGMDLFVCPDLFEVPYEFPTLGECPSVAPGRFDVPYDSPTRLSYNRLMMTINTLARKYVPNVVPDNKKIFDINDCFNAQRNDQLNNGFNYAYYAACKSSFSMHNPTFLSKKALTDQSVQLS